MGWLKTVGRILAKVGEYVVLGGPVIASLFPGSNVQQIENIAATVIGKAINIIADVEAVGAAVQLTGPQKLTAAIGPIGDLMLQFFAGKKIKDAAKWHQGVANFSSGLADMLSALDDDHIQTANPVK